MKVYLVTSMPQYAQPYDMAAVVDIYTDAAEAEACRAFWTAISGWPHRVQEYEPPARFRVPVPPFTMPDRLGPDVVHLAEDGNRAMERDPDVVFARNVEEYQRLAEERRAR